MPLLLQRARMQGIWRTSNKKLPSAHNCRPQAASSGARTSPLSKIKSIQRPTPHVHFHNSKSTVALSVFLRTMQSLKPYHLNVAHLDNRRQTGHTGHPLRNACMLTGCCQTWALHSCAVSQMPTGVHMQTPLSRADHLLSSCSGVHGSSARCTKATPINKDMAAFHCYK